MTSHGVALRTARGQAYDAGAVRDLLALEEVRCARAGHTSALVLIDVHDDTGGSARIPSALAARLFSILWSCTRASDVIGWYREHRVVAVVLTALDPAHASAVCDGVVRRIGAAIRGQLRGTIASRMRLRVSINHHRARRAVVDATSVPAP